MPSNHDFYRAKNTVDTDDAIWEKNEDGTVVKRQPGIQSDQCDAAGGPYVQRFGFYNFKQKLTDSVENYK